MQNSIFSDVLLCSPVYGHDFRRNLLPPSSVLEDILSKQRTHLPAICSSLFSMSSTLEIESISSSESL
jgi:hypothetical protein